MKPITLLLTSLCLIGIAVQSQAGGVSANVSAHWEQDDRFKRYLSDREDGQWDYFKRLLKKTMIFQTLHVDWLQSQPLDIIINQTKALEAAKLCAKLYRDMEGKQKLTWIEENEIINTLMGGRSIRLEIAMKISINDNRESFRIESQFALQTIFYEHKSVMQLKEIKDMRQVVTNITDKLIRSL
jgi:hypothetical protein